MANLQVRVIKNIVKEYPDMYKVISYKSPKYFVNSDSIKRSREEVDSDTYVPKISSLQRTKTLVKDIVLCNNFELFCTFTFDPEKVDSYDFRKCWFVMSRWLHHQYNNSREKGIKFEYLIIPERHKSGRWHFHALLSGYTSTLHDSGLVTTSLNPLFNVTSFRSGFTTAVRIESKEGVSSYITKYITKDFITTFNQRRFFCSRGLVRPIKETNSLLYEITPPLFRHLIGENSQNYEFLIDKKDALVHNRFMSSKVAQYRVEDLVNSRKY